MTLKGLRTHPDPQENAELLGPRCLWDLCFNSSLRAFDDHLAIDLLHLLWLWWDPLLYPSRPRVKWLARAARTESWNAMGTGKELTRWVLLAGRRVFLWGFWGYVAWRYMMDLLKTLGTQVIRMLHLSFIHFRTLSRITSHLSLPRFIPNIQDL